MEILNCRAAVSELRWLTFTSCCFIAYCARPSSRSRFGNYNQVRAHASRRGNTSMMRYWWGTYRNPTSSTLISHNMSPQMRHQPFKRLSAQCLPLPSDPLWFYGQSWVQTAAVWQRLAQLSSLPNPHLQRPWGFVWEALGAGPGRARTWEGRERSVQSSFLSPRGILPQKGPLINFKD